MTCLHVQIADDLLNILPAGDEVIENATALRHDRHVRLLAAHTNINSVGFGYIMRRFIYTLRQFYASFTDRGESDGPSPEDPIITGIKTPP